MSTTAVPAEAKKQCSYEHGGWHCRFDVEDGHDLCMFHLSIDEKTPEDFWRHLQIYLSVLYAGAVDDEASRFWQERRAWIAQPGAPVARELLEYYRRVVGDMRPWRFRGFVFPEMDGAHTFDGFVFRACDFRDARFCGAACFCDAAFSGEADFHLANFDGEADFQLATFSGGVNFSSTMFNGDAIFENAKCGGRADFSYGTFEGQAEFSRAKFGGRADFSHRTFKDEAAFFDAEFGDEVVFARAKFNGAVTFGKTAFNAEANFERTEFHGETVSFQDAGFAGPVYLRRTTVGGLLFLAYANLRNQVFFDGTILKPGAKVLLWGLNFVFGRSSVTMEERALRSQRVSAAVTTTQQSRWKGNVVEPAGQVVFRDITSGMNQVSFLHTDILTDRLLVRFSNVRWETGARRFIFDALLAFIKHGERNRKELIEKTGLPGGVIDRLPELFFADRPPPSGETREQRETREKQELQDCEPLVKQDVERVAREIRLSHEKYGNYPDAGNYYVAEMDFRRARLAPKAWLKWPAMWLYGLVSRYGESPSRALASLLVVLLGFGFAFVIAGFKFMGQTVNRDLRFVWAERWTTLGDIWLAVRMALANLMPGNLRGDVLGLELTSPATKTWAIAQVIATYILLTLLLLAVRRRFRR